MKTLVDEYVEYDGDTCELISSGSWALASGPKYGVTNTGTAYGYLANGDCPDTKFPFATPYYTWTSTADATKDVFSATWTSGNSDFPPQTDRYTITLGCGLADTPDVLSGQTFTTLVNFGYEANGAGPYYMSLSRADVYKRQAPAGFPGNGSARPQKTDWNAPDRRVAQQPWPRSMKPRLFRPSARRGPCWAEFCGVDLRNLRRVI